MNDSWCPLPWMSCDTRSNGDLRVCTHAQHGTDKGLLRNADGRPFNAGVDDIDESRNSPMLKSVRLSMLEGKWHDACKRCKDEFDSGMVSRNLVEIDLWKDRFTLEDAKAHTSQDGSIDTAALPLMYYGLRFGNKCNLKCRMCGPTESNLWYDDYAKVWDTDKFEDTFGTVRLVKNESGKLSADTDRYSWYESDVLWDHMSRNASNILHVHTVGGEPTMIDEQYEFISRCIDQGIAGQMIIEYNSNVAKIPDKAWELWRHFKEVRIGASIDGIGEVNEYIRHPSKWEFIERNLRRIDGHDGINFLVWIASTVQAYNIYYLPEILEYFLLARFRRIGLDQRSPLVNFHPLYGPKWLSAKVLPAGTKAAIIQRFTDSLPRLDDMADGIHGDDRYMAGVVKQGIRNHLDNYGRFMLSEDLSHMMPKFWGYTSRLDDIRGESMQRSLPGLFECIRGNWKE